MVVGSTVVHRLRRLRVVGLLTPVGYLLLGGQAGGLGSGLDDVAAEGEPVDDRGAQAVRPGRFGPPLHLRATIAHADVGGGLEVGFVVTDAGDGPVAASGASGDGSFVRVAGVRLIDPAVDRDSVVRLAAGLGQCWGHELALAIVAEALRCQLEIPEPANSRVEWRCGVIGVVDGHAALLGHAEWLREYNVPIPETEVGEGDGVYLATAQRLWARIDFSIVGGRC